MYKKHGYPSSFGIEWGNSYANIMECEDSYSKFYGAYSSKNDDGVMILTKD